MNITYFDPASAQPIFNIEKGLQAYVKHFFIGLFILNIVLGVVYLMMLNALATQGFDMESLKAEQLSYQKEVEDMDILLAIPSSIYALESDEFVQEMVSINTKNFISVEAENVAVNF